MANTGSTTSSMTSTSHTMTALPPPTTKSSEATLQNSERPTSMAELLQALAPANRHVFIQPTIALGITSLDFVKRTLDSFAGTLGEEQAERQKQLRKKRKRGDTDVGDVEVLKIRRVYTEGFEVGQIWEQAKRVIDALRDDAERSLAELEQAEVESDGDEIDGEEGGGVGLPTFDEDGFEVGYDGESSVQDQEGEEDADVDVEEQEEEDFEDAGMDGEADGDDEELLNGHGGDEYDESEGGEPDEENPEVFVEDPNGLNDGFFSIDEFNKQTEFLERQDATADPYTGEASDEEDIDWDADPMSMSAKPVLSSRRAVAMDVESDAEEDSDEGSVNGPTFGNADLNAPEGDSDIDEEDDMEKDVDVAGDNTNDILYKDFFEPPRRKAGKGERQADYLARQSRKPKLTEAEDDEAGVERAMADVRRDLFDDLSDKEDSEDALSDLDPADPKSRRSAHERKQAKLAEEIRRLEAASVAKRQWTLAGEARAADRAVNSLLDEKLDYEHTGKPIPEITAEISESIEELIKRRILAQEFDEVTRRRPDALSTPANTRRGAFELDDTKPKQSLAEMYEEEHVKANNPDTYVSQADEKMRNEEKEIEALWKKVSANLDALSSWHYKPKPAAPSLTIVADVPTISMEDAQPTTAAGVSGGESMLAPQEIYKAGQEKESIEKGEVVPKSGAPVARQEMTREEKLRRRRREKERIKKRGGVEINQRPQSKKTQEKRETIGELKKGGVKVIDRKGNVRDVDGNKVQASSALNGAGSFKL